METILFALSGISLVMVGIFGILTKKNIIKILLALNLMETGINLFVVSMGFFKGGKAPIITSSFSASSLNFVDPLPHALVLTSIVIGLGTTALALTLTLNYFREHKTVEFGGEKA